MKKSWIALETPFGDQIWYLFLYSVSKFILGRIWDPTGLRKKSWIGFFHQLGYENLTFDREPPFFTRWLNIRENTERMYGETPLQTLQKHIANLISFRKDVNGFCWYKRQIIGLFLCPVLWPDLKVHSCKSNQCLSEAANQRLSIDLYQSYIFSDIDFNLG